MTRRWISFGLALSIGCGPLCSSQLLAKTEKQVRTQPAQKPDAAQKQRSERSKANPRSAGSEKLQTQRLGGVDRYLTYLSTDKPIYRGGENVYLRGVVLNAANHRPVPADLLATASIQIKGPKGDTVTTGNASLEDSVWGFQWNVPPVQAGGEYTAYVTYPWDGLTPTERKFDIRSFRAPRLKSQITFARDGYGPGDKVTATLDSKRAEGGIPEGAPVTVIARVDGTEIRGTATNINDQGLSTVTFELPRNIPRGEGTLSLSIEDGGIVETASKTIPILLQTVDLQMYPEGGDLLAGFRNRVYIQAHLPNGKPADLSGRLMWKKNSETGFVSNFRTEHEGRGRFEFVPEGDKEYFLSISEPTGIKTTYPLPEIKFKGAVISTISDTYKKGEPIKVSVGCTDKACRVTLSKRELEVANDVIVQSKAVNKNERKLQTVSFDPSPHADGVLVATVWDENDNPLAERLIFRDPAEEIKISISSSKQTFAPGDTAKVTVKTTNGDGKPVSSVVGLTVTDDTVLELVEKREKAPRLPVMVFLEPEVQDLADANVYLDKSNAKAPLQTDLLLGTQGWRRFAFMDVDKFLQEKGDAARRVLALNAKTLDSLRRKSRLINGRIGEQGRNSSSAHAVPEEIGKIEGPRDFNLFQVEPTVIDERHYTSGRSERHQRTSPIPDGENMGAQLGQLSSVDKYTFFPGGPFVPSRESRPSVYFREFAHKVRPDRKPSDRVDFDETLYWSSGVKTDAKTGEATVEFGLNDNVTTFRVFADAFTDSGAVGTSNKGIESVQPIYADAKIPLEVTAGDQILLPINVVNGTKGAFPNVKLNVQLDGDSKLSPLQKSESNTEASGRVRWIQPIQVGTGNDVKNLTVTADAGEFKDQMTRKLSIKPQGFPTEVAFGGVLTPGKPEIHTITIANAAPNSVSSNTAVYPTPLANMTEALQRMIQDPSGCFEQTSSTSYPLTMAQQYFITHTSVDPKLVASAREKLDAGYKKLVSFWCPDRGYEWFGENPGHEALTAFGLLHFADMAQVRDVDQKMVATTREWLMKQKDGQGGFTRKRRALHTWNEDKDCSNAYIVWALLETGQPASDLKTELAALKTASEASRNNYVVALAANAMYLAGDKTEAKKLMDRLASKQLQDGSVDGMTNSIVCSTGPSLQVEGTALAVLAWLRDPAYASNVEKSIKYLADSCKDGRYGSTQATVLALRSIVAYDKLRAHPKKPGKIREYVDGKPIGDYITFDQSTQGALKLPDLGEVLTPGEHKVELRMEGGNPMPYSMAAKYNALTPASATDCKLNIAVRMAQDKVAEGNATEANVVVSNATSEVIPSPIAIIGLPGGVEVRHDQLKELKKKGIIDNYEVRGREVILYWRAMDKNSKVEVPLSVIAAVPGTYTGPASRAYLYYSDESKRWADGLHVEITPKNQMVSLTR